MNGKPLKGVKQRDDMTRLAFLSDPFDFHVESDSEKASVHMNASDIFGNKIKRS